jgi:hypothetical protein
MISIWRTPADDRSHRTNIILLHSWLSVESCSIEFVSREGLRRRMRRRPFDKFSKLWIIYTTTMLFTEVCFCDGNISSSLTMR